MEMPSKFCLENMRLFKKTFT